MPPAPEIIDLVSDSEDEAPPPVAAARGRRLPDYDNGRFAPIEPDNDIFAEYFPDLEPPDDPALPAFGDLADVPLVIDDFGYLEEELQHDPEATTDPEESDFEQPHVPGPDEENYEQLPIPDVEPVVSRAHCLARVYELFPEMCPEHAKTVCDTVGGNSLLSAAALLDLVVEKLLADNNYPKRKKEAQNLKRKREESVDDDYQQWERENREALPHNVAVPIRAILKAEFPTFTHASIGRVLAEEKYLFKSYIHLAKLRDTDLVTRRGRASAVHSDAEMIAASSPFPGLKEELLAARKRAQANRALRMEAMAKKLAEDQNLQHAIATGGTAECQACFDDLPINRQIHCHGEIPHFTCFSCIKTYIATEIGDARCRVMCTAGCGAGFEPVQLNLIDDKRLLGKLADLQQEQDIRDAGLEDLEECPFCEYKAIMPPVEEDFEFRCANPECEKVSCRRCKALTHIPISCEQHAKDKKASGRHTIEEAMTAALLRSCNNCKKQFIKEFGCNKMTCPSCKNLQCYVCSETLKGYDHFDQHPGGGPRVGGKCPLYDNLEQRHEREVQAAKETATALVIAKNPDVAREDLEIKVSEAVKKSTERQIRQAGPEGLGGGPVGRWAGGMFAAGPQFGGMAHHFDEDDDDDEDDGPLGDDDMDQFGLPLGLGPNMRAGLQAQAMLRRQRLEDIDMLPAFAQGNMVHAGLHARLRRQQARRRQVEDDMRVMGLAMRADRAPPLGPPDMAQQIADARAAVPGAPQRPNVQQHNHDRVDERPNRNRPQPALAQQLAPVAPGDLHALFQDFEQFPRALPQYLQAPHFQQMAQPRAPEFAPLDDPHMFQRGPVHVNRGFGLARVRAQHPQPPVGIGAAGGDPIPGPPPGWVPHVPNAQLNAAGLANVQRHLHDLELMRQQHDERTGNVPMAVPGAQRPPRRVVDWREPQHYGWQ